MENWDKIGTLERLAMEGYTVVAINLPKKGRSTTILAPDEFLLAFLKSTGFSSVVIVSPSLSGTYSLSFVTDENLYRDSTLAGIIRGYVPIAPVAVKDYEQKFSTVPIPVLIFYGELDPMVRDLNLIKQFSNNQVSIIPEAGHPCYLTQSNTFHTVLIQWLNKKVALL
jgi:abhydrolase domain-containing protein 14